MFGCFMWLNIIFHFFLMVYEILKKSDMGDSIILNYPGNKIIKVNFASIKSKNLIVFSSIIIPF